MHLDPTLRSQILSSLLPLHPDKIVLFGSQASGAATEESDIDIYIVTDDDTLPRSFAEKMTIKLRYAKALRELRKRMPIELLVHTRMMHKIFIERDSYFSKEISNNWIVLYEKKVHDWLESARMDLQSVRCSNLDCCRMASLVVKRRNIFSNLPQ